MSHGMVSYGHPNTCILLQRKRFRQTGVLTKQEFVSTKLRYANENSHSDEILKTNFLCNGDPVRYRTIWISWYGVTNRQNYLFDETLFKV
jgi:hypothetical protein